MYCLIGEVIDCRSPFYRIETEQIVFKLCPVLCKWSFSKSSSRCWSGRKSESPQGDTAFRSDEHKTTKQKKDYLDKFKRTSKTTSLI